MTGHLKLVSPGSEASKVPSYERPAGPHAVIDWGTVTKSTDRSDVGKAMFFVEYVDEDGGRVGDYSGSSYAAAQAAAMSWEVSVVDLVPLAVRPVLGSA